MVRGRAFKEMKKPPWIRLFQSLLSGPHVYGMSTHFHQARVASDSISTTLPAGGHWACILTYLTSYL